MKKVSSLFIALLFILVAQSVQAVLYIPIDIPVDIRNQQFTHDYGRIPPSTLGVGDVVFNFPTVSMAQPYDFFAFYDLMPDTQWTVNGGSTSYDTMTMPVTGVTSTTMAYLLLNTNWGQESDAGKVTFNTSTGDHLDIILTGDFNIRDWNSSGGYTDSLTAANATANGFSVTPNVFSVTPDLYGGASTGRIDMLTVDLKNLLNSNGEYLTSIVFTDYGSDEWSTASSGGPKSDIASRIRVEGVTIDGIKSIPEPSTLLLLALGLCVLGFVRTRFSKA